MYLGVAAAIRDGYEGAGSNGTPRDFPTVYDGARGVHFIEKTVESARSDKKWTDARWGAVRRQQEAV